MLILECSIRMYGVRVDKKSCVYSEEEEIGHFRLGSRCVKKKKKKGHTQKKCPMSLINTRDGRDIYIWRN